MKIFSRALTTLGSLFLLSVSACSLKVPHSVGPTLKINIEETQPAQFISSLMFGPTISATTPTVTSDFNCFTVNVTGDGIGPSNRFGNCSISNNPAGVGALAAPVTRGNSLELDIPAGRARKIDVYGIYPSVTECGGGGGGSGTSSAGYYLGSKTVDLVNSTNVTIPINFTAGTTGTLTCSGGGGGFKYYAYAIGGGKIQQMAFDPTTGTLTDIGTAITGAGSRLRGAPGSTYLYATSGSTSADIYALANATGILSVAGSKTVGSTVTNFLVAPNKSFFWAMDSAFINAFSIDSFGALTTGPTPAITPVNASAVTPNSLFVYVADSTLITPYTVNTSTGNLSAGSTAAGASLNSMVVDPSGNYLYATTTGTAFYYTLNSSTGAITANSSVTLAGSVNSLAMDPLGRFLYAVRGSVHLIQNMTIASGVLTADASTYDTLGTNSNFAMVDPDGRYLLVSNNGSSNISVMPINPSTGALGTAVLHSLSFTPSDIFITKVQGP